MLANGGQILANRWLLVGIATIILQPTANHWLLVGNVG